MRCRRLSYVCALVTLLMLSPATAAAKPGTSWAQAELKTVVAAGLMARAAAARPNDSLTRGELDAIVAGLTHTQPATSANPSAKVTIAGLDSRLVAALGLTDTARLFTEAAKTAGLAPPSRFGTEAVARRGQLAEDVRLLVGRGTFRRPDWTLEVEGVEACLPMLGLTPG